MAEDAIELAEGTALDGGKKKGLFKPILFVVVGILLIGGSVGATLLLTGSGSQEQEMMQGDSKAGGKEGEKLKVAKSDAIYVPLLPFTVSLQGDNSHRFLQVSVSVMSRNDEVISAIQEHLPAVRNNLNILFSSQTYAGVATREGKMKLQRDAIQEIQSILTMNNEPTSIEAVYFTNLVVD